ncbi:MAG: SDR family oxidoreductase, partial [Dehalococcoidia bacterium]
MKLKGRAAIVTGASRGIGRGIALAMAKAGADVLVNYASNRQGAEETAKEVQSMGRKAVAYQADVKDLDRVKAMMAAAVEAFGKVDILVSNAGVIDRGSYVYEADLDRFHELIDTHIMGAFHCIQAALPTMRQQERGDIHLISSANTVGLPDALVSYNVAKAGLQALGLCLAKEERGNNIRVNIIAPALVETDMGRPLLQRLGLSSFEELGQYLPFGRVIQPRDVANLCVFLAS